MKISQLISMIRSCELSNLSEAKFTDGRILHFINLAILELSKRFNIEVKAECIKTSPYTNVYSLRNKDVIGIVEIYDEEGNELRPQTIIGEESYDYRMINNFTFMVKRKEEYPKLIEYATNGIEQMQETSFPNSQLMVVYSALSDLVETVEDELTVPMVFVDPIVAYVEYKAMSSLNANEQGETNIALAKYENSCKTLEKSAYNGGEVVLSKSVDMRGFV